MPVLQNRRQASGLCVMCACSLHYAKRSHHQCPGYRHPMLVPRDRFLISACVVFVVKMGCNLLNQSLWIGGPSPLFFFPTKQYGWRHPCTFFFCTCIWLFPRDRFLELILEQSADILNVVNIASVRVCLLPPPPSARGHVKKYKHSGMVGWKQQGGVRVSVPDSALLFSAPSVSSHGLLKPPL